MKELYKMILVDDEDEVRGRISSKISNESGFSVVGAAGNGYDALELIEKYSPHVVLTDIKMPFIDGIELTSIIRRDFPTVRVAFITGYDEFDYAREAIELNVSSFLTKPVTQADISKFLDKLKIELDNEFKEKYNLEKLRKQYEKSIPLIIENYFISSLISSEIGQTDENIAPADFGINLNDGYLLLFLKLEHGSIKGNVIDYEKLKFSVRSVAGNIIERCKFEYYSFMFNDGIIFLIRSVSGDFLKKIDPVLYEVVKMTEKYLSVKIDIGISQIKNRPADLYAAYQEADKALGYSKLLNTGRIIYISQLEENIKPRTLNLSDSEIKNIEYTLKFGTDAELESVIKKMKKNALKDKMTVTNYRIYLLKLANIIISFSESAGIDLHQIVNEDIIDKLSEFRNIEHIFDWIENVFSELRELNIKTKQSNSDRILEKAVRFIDTNYAKTDISMEKTCEELGTSVSYLSHLFKKNRNTTFIKYLTAVRMEKAKELLKLTHDRIIEIAEKCGYNDVYYFSHSFKKYMGVSPKSYREKCNS